MLLFVCFSANAQIADKNNYYVNKGNHTEIAFELISNLIVVPVFINNSDSMYLILDTGLKTNLITNPPRTDSLFYHYAREMTIKGLGTDEDLTVVHSYGNDLKVGQLYGKNTDCFVLKDDRFDLSGEMGTQINGLIGSELFLNTVVEIDYVARKLDIYEAGTFKYRRRHRKRYEKFPLEFHKNKPYISLPVKMKNGNTVRAKLLIDIGSSDALWLFPNDDNISIPEERRYSYLGKGLNGSIFGYRSRIDKLIIGKYIFDDVSCSFPDSSSIAYSEEYDIKGRNGSIGGELMRRFHVIFDYPNKQILLRKNRFFKDDFNFNMAGFDAEAPYGLLPIYTVKFVREKSPAAESGLKEGDMIVRINGLDASNYKLSEIYNMTHGRAGRKIRLKINRNGKILKIKIKLREEL